MTEQLPITIKASVELLEQFIKIPSILNKLEAQFNFQTLTAGWYGDEDNILSISLYLETPESFYFQKTQKMLGQLYNFADDVFIYHDGSKNQICCFIAFTETELQLLIEQEKLLPSFVQTKIHKVLNLIAQKLMLVAI